MSFEENDQGQPFYEEREIRVDGGQSPVRIDKFLGLRLENISRNKIQNGIRAGTITVNGETCKANYKVRPLDTIRIIIPRYEGSGDRVTPEDIPLDIMHEDESILIVNKPPGMVVHPGISNYSGTLVNALAYHIDKSQLPVMKGNPLDRPGLVHRIDKDTSGLLVIAKTEYAMAHLARQFFDHTIERQYAAIVWSTPDPPEGTITGNIGRHPRNRLLQTVFTEGDEGKHAVTHYEVVEDLYYVSLIKCWLETGRTHQIRVHMSHIGHPVFNDNRYDGDRIRKGTVFSKYKQFVQNCFDIIPRQALHARTLGFIHPGSGEHVTFDCGLPADFEDVLNKWRHYLIHRKEQM